MKNIIYTISLVLLFTGCAQDQQNFDCLWRGTCEDATTTEESSSGDETSDETSDEGSTNDEDSNDTSQSDLPDNCIVEGILNSSKTDSFVIEHGASDSVSCDVGFAKVGSLSCDDGSILGTVTCESTECIISGIENSSETSEFTIADGESDSVTCDAGYTKSGSVTCSNTEASGIITCVPDSCTISAVANSDASAEFSLAHGATDSINCDGGYTKVGAISCSLGVTSGSVSCMDSNDCLIESGVANSNKTTSYVVKDGETTNDVNSLVSCDAGYTKVGSISCASGTTTIISPLSCKQDCTLGAITNSDHTSSGTITHGLSELVTCNTGYSDSATSETFSCDDGTLTGSLTCTIQTYSTSIDNLASFGSDTSGSISLNYGDTVAKDDVTCDAGYKSNLTDEGAEVVSDGAGGVVLSPAISCAAQEWLVQLHGNGYTDASSTPLAFTANGYQNTFTADADGNIFGFGSNGADGLVTKLDPEGNVIWSQLYQASLSHANAKIGSHAGTDIFRDSLAFTKRSPTTGEMETFVYFTIETTGNFEVGVTGGGSDCAVGKMDSDGILRWVQQIDSTDANVGSHSGGDYCSAIAVIEDPEDSSNEIVYVGGYTTGILENDNNLFNSGRDGYIARLSGSDGSISWLKHVPEEGSCGNPSYANQSDCISNGENWTGGAHVVCLSVGADESGNVFCAGSTTLNSIKDGGVITGTTDIFVAAFDRNGSFLDSYQHGKPGHTYLNHIAVYDLDDSVDANGVTIFGGGKTTGRLDDYPNSGGDDAFLLMLDFNKSTNTFGTSDIEQVTNVEVQSPSGNAAGDESCRRVAVDAEGDLYALCYTTSAMLGDANAGSYQQPLLIKLERNTLNQLSIVALKKYGDTFAASSAGDKINSTSQGDLVQVYWGISEDYGNKLGSSIMINLDGSIYFGSNTDQQFAAARTAANGDTILVKDGAQTDWDPWVMKIQECVGDLKLRTCP